MKELEDSLLNANEYVANKLNILRKIHQNYISFDINYNVYEIALSNFRNNQIMLDDNISDNDKTMFILLINNMLNVI